jgi:methylmalonyl-CoA mutase
MLAFFLNTAIDQQCEKYLVSSNEKEIDAATYDRIRSETIRQVRGTVQADILKEDQAQNTCIFSTEFALKLMGDVQQYFIDNDIRNFYSVSISGYHIAEGWSKPGYPACFHTCQRIHLSRILPEPWHAHR